MQIHIRINWKRIIYTGLAIIFLFALASCGGKKDEKDDTKPSKSPKPKSTQAATKAPDDDLPSPTPIAKIPGGFVAESDALFAIVLGAPTDMGTPTKVVNCRLAEEKSQTFSFCVVPLRDGIEISIENILSFDLRPSDMPYTVLESRTTELGTYYFINAFSDAYLYAYDCVRIVAQDGATQASFLFDPAKHSGNSEFLVAADTIPSGLDTEVMQSLSCIAASVVWRYGEALGWVDEIGFSEGPITPQQLALSQAAYRLALENVIPINEYTNPGNSDYDGKQAQYAAALFPNVQANRLPKADIITDITTDYFTWLDEVRFILAAASADGETGYVIIGIPYVNSNGRFEDFYRVDWAAAESFDVYSPFRYQLVGVQPMERQLWGGLPKEHFIKRHLGRDAAAARAALGITQELYLDTPGSWAAGDIVLIKAVGDDEYLATFILADDDGSNATYLGASIDLLRDIRSLDDDLIIDDGWLDLGILRIPPSSSYETHILDDITIEVYGPFGAASLWAGWLMANSIESQLANANSYEGFVFNDGHIGYVLYFDSHIEWLREDWMSLQLQHGGDISIYEDNRELFWKISRSLTVTE